MKHFWARSRLSNFCKVQYKTSGAKVIEIQLPKESLVLPCEFNQTAGITSIYKVEYRSGIFMSQEENIR